MYVMQFSIIVELIAFIVSITMLVKLFLQKESRKIISAWGYTTLVLLILIVAYFAPTSFKWNAPASETTIRILGKGSTITIGNPLQKEDIISSLSSIPFQRPFFNSKPKSYDSNIETYFLIRIQAGKEIKEITISVATSDNHINFIETESGLQANDPNQFLNLFNSILM